MMFAVLFAALVAALAPPASGQPSGGPPPSPTAPALPINPVQNGSTFAVTCASYSQYACLKQGQNYVSTPHCVANGGSNQRLPVGNTSTSMCCFNYQTSCSAYATAINLAISPTCNTSAYGAVFITTNATDATFARCTSICLPKQHMVRYTPLEIVAGQGVFATAPGMCAPPQCPTGNQNGAMCCNASSMQTLLGPDALGNATAIALASAARWTTAEICRPAVSCDSPDAQCLGDCRAPPANRTNMVITDATCESVGPAMKMKSSADEDVAFVLLGLVLAAAAVIILLYVRRLKSTEDSAYELGQNASVRERLLDAEIDRLRKAWEIAEASIVRTKLIAKGAFATVWKGSWGHIPVAVKIPLGDWDEWSDPEAIKEFEDEASKLQSIRHPNLVTFYGAGKTAADSQPFLVFELMELGSLRSLLQSERGFALAWHVRLRFAAEIAAGMQHLHALGIIHRDLKPDNCLVDSNMHTKVADFGSSTSGMASSTNPVIETALTNRRRLKSASESQMGGKKQLLMTQHVGTPLWRAPETMLAVSDYGFPIDVWSFGIMMWELVTRTDPWADIEGESALIFENNLRKAVYDGVRPVLPENAPCAGWYVALMNTCWTTDPEGRPDFNAVSQEMTRHAHFFHGKIEAR